MDFESQISQLGAPPGTSGLLRGGPLVAGVEVSVLVSEAHNLTANPTKLALESGSQVTDHVIVNPNDVSVVFAMTNAGGGADTARDVFETFKRLLDDRELVELTTEHHVYEDMVIVGVSPLHQAPYKGALSTTLRLQQITFVKLQSVGREPDKLPQGDPVEKTAAGPVNAGQQDPKPVSGTALQKITAAKAENDDDISFNNRPSRPSQDDDGIPSFDNRPSRT